MRDQIHSRIKQDRDSDSLTVPFSLSLSLLLFTSFHLSYYERPAFILLLHFFHVKFTHSKETKLIDKCVCIEIGKDRASNSRALRDYKRVRARRNLRRINLRKTVLAVSRLFVGPISGS